MRSIWTLRFCIMTGAGALALAACVGTSQFTKDGASESEIRDDLSSCQNQARTLSSKDDDITQDIKAAHRESIRSGVTEFVNEVDDIEPQRLYENVVDECMNRLGYHSG